jgi:DNA-binding NtrC family response regulator
MAGVSMEQLLTTESRTTLKDMLDAFERQIIEEALLASQGNQRRAAHALGVLPTTLHEKMKRLGLLRRAEPHASGRDLGGQLAMVG